jgi:hypothetical protein
MSGWTVCKYSVPVARVTSTEFEMSPRGKMIQEISLTAEGYATMNDAEDILKFMSKQFPKSKIEINLDNIQKYD